MQLLNKFTNGNWNWIRVVSPKLNSFIHIYLCGIEPIESKVLFSGRSMVVNLKFVAFIYCKIHREHDIKYGFQSSLLTSQQGTHLGVSHHLDMEHAPPSYNPTMRCLRTKHTSFHSTELHFASWLCFLFLEVMLKLKFLRSPAVQVSRLLWKYLLHSGDYWPNWQKNCTFRI